MIKTKKTKNKKLKKRRHKNSSFRFSTDVYIAVYNREFLIFNIHFLSMNTLSR